MITSFLNSVDLPSVSGNGIAFEAGIANSQVLYNLPSTALGGTFTVITLNVGGDTSNKIRIDKSYSGKQLGFIKQDRSSFLFTYTSGGGGTASITATANYFDNVGPVQRRKVQSYEA
jgi:hypothetical protein